LDFSRNQTIKESVEESSHEFLAQNLSLALEHIKRKPEVLFSSERINLILNERRDSEGMTY